MSMLLPACKVLIIFSTDVNAILFQPRLYLTLRNFATGTPKEMYSPFYSIGLLYY